MYLGVPIGSNMNRVDNWKGVIDKFKSRLSKWKAKLLSVRGRLTLIKAVLGSIAIYYMSIFRTPMAVVNILESIRNNFFIGANMEERKATWIKWKKTMASKRDGGLGIGSLYGFNRALLFKWKWRFVVSPDAYWAKILKGLYGDKAGLDGKFPQDSAGSMWGNILKVSKELGKKNIDLDVYIKRKVGDGRTTKFWEDAWVMDKPLKDIYTRVFRLDMDSEASVADRKHWNVTDGWWRRPPRGGVETQQWDSIKALIEEFMFSQNEDKWAWMGDSSGEFSVASARSMIDKGTLIVGNAPTRWISHVPIKVNVFLWKLCLDKLPTRWNLSRRGMDIPTIRCVICGDMNETGDHIVMCCSMAKEIWSLVERWWSISIPIMHSVNEIFIWLDNVKISLKCKQALKVVVTAVAWTIWDYRNKTIFDTKKPRRSLLFDAIVSYSFLWYCNRSNSPALSWIGFLSNPVIAINSL